MNTRFALVMVSVGTCILLSAWCTEASAESDIGFKAIGPRIGYVDPEGSLAGTVEFGVAFEFAEFVRQLHWDGSVSFWSTGRESQFFDNRFNWKLRDLVFRSGVNYHFLGGEWVPYAGGGLGLHFYSWDYNGAPYYNNRSDSKFGVYLDGGIEHQFNENWTGQMQIQGDFGDWAEDPAQTALLFNLIYRLM